jgi:hypothetical protein
MEIAVQIAYIHADGVDSLSRQRAGHYLANLWREAPPELKSHIPPSAMIWWENVWEEFAKDLPKRGWRPNFKEMFSLLGKLEVYEEDYSFLSAIAHGSTREAIVHYSMSRVNLRPDTHVPVLLVYATKYYLAIAHIWEERFRLIDQDEYLKKVDPLLHELSKES